MALATQCPHCQTTFRVAHDQLKLRAGLVRCGACKQIFNGIENLLRPEDIAPAGESSSEPPQIATSQAPAIAGDATQPTTIITSEESVDAPVRQAQTPASETADDVHSVPEADGSAVATQTSTEEEAEEADNPLLRMTLMDFTHASQKPTNEMAQAEDAPKDQPDPLERAIDDLQRKPWRSTEEETDLESDELDLADHAEYEEPSFVKLGRRRQRIGNMLRICMTAALPLLLVGMLAQGTYIFRNQLAAWFPQARPLLSKACTYIDCQIGLPMQMESVSIESSELQALAVDQNTFSLVALLRNRGDTVQAWPSVELTLNDANEKALARRVFMPRDYLPSSQEINKGFAPKSEQSIKLFFELPQLKASGYRVYLFYP